MNNFKEILKNIKFKIINLNYFSNKNKIKLNKNSTYNNIVIKFSNYLIDANNIKDIENFSLKIKYFIMLMEKNCENFNSKNLVNNFKKTLFDISKIGQEKITHGDVGYNYKDKSITFSLNGFLVTNHELLHLSTLDKDTGICGFHNNGTGLGLNEAYTQLLTERYFNESVGKSYFIETKLINILEQVIGQDNMEKYYFNVSINSLINELSKYENESNIVKFINDMDKLLKVDINYIENPTIEQVKEFQGLISNLCNFLLSCIKNKIDILISLNQTDKAIEFYNNLNLFECAIKTSSDGNSYNINFFDLKFKKDIEKSIFDSNFENIRKK